MAIVVNAYFTQTGVSVRGPDGDTMHIKNDNGQQYPSNARAAVERYAEKYFSQWRPVTALDAGPGNGWWFVIGE